MTTVGLIGDPVEHSISPAMHNAAFAALKMADWQYSLLPTSADEIEARVQSIREGKLGGANVTIPHKQAIIPFLDSVVLSARGVQAVNTILVEDGRLIGHNTDIAGFLLDLEAHGVKPYGRRALVIGAGGAAHAAALGLANGGATVTIMTRREQQAWDLRNNLRRGVSRQLNINVQPMNVLDRVAPDIDLIIHSTPLGMYPHSEQSIWPDSVPFPRDAVLYDMVYRPQKTLLMKQAKEHGLKVIGGLGMLVYQGALSFELWTGQTAPFEVMYEAAQEALEK